MAAQLDSFKEGALFVWVRGTAGAGQYAREVCCTGTGVAFEGLGLVSSC